MQTLRFLVFSTAVTLCCGSTFGLTHGSVTLSFDPPATLPGLPVTIRLTARNDSPVELTLPRKAILLVTPSNGEPFVARFGSSSSHEFDRAEIPEADEQTRLPPRRETTIVFPAANATWGPAWFHDTRLNLPGTYRLQMLLLDSFSDKFVWDTPLSELTSAPTVRYVSTEAVLTIEQPKGEDAVVWKLFLDTARDVHRTDRWTPIYGGEGAFVGRVVKPTIDEHPASGYAPYLVSSYPADLAVRRAVGQRILAMHPDTPVRDYIRLGLARDQVRAANQAVSTGRPDVKFALSTVEGARQELEALERDTNDPVLRKSIHEELKGLPTAEKLIAAAEAFSRAASPQ